MQHVICYVSTASPDLNDGNIKKLFDTWQEKNAEKDIRGILLFSEGHFFQVLEGERTAVLNLYNKINLDTRHKGIIQVLGKDIKKGSLDGYLTQDLSEKAFSRPELISSYCESVKGMDDHTQEQIKNILDSFIDTQVL